MFYDAGLGTDIGTTALTAPVRFVQKLLGSVTGAGIKHNIADCYEFIVNHYEEGDRIFLFGFSRGAYTVRSLANLLMLCGVPTKTPGGALMRYRKAAKDIAWEAVDTVLEHGAGHPRAEFEDERLELAKRFQLKYGSGDGSDSNVAPYFIGVFDTVAALGASGLRYLVIQAGLAAGVAAAAFAAGFLPSVLIARRRAALRGRRHERHPEYVRGQAAEVALAPQPRRWPELGGQTPRHRRRCQGPSHGRAAIRTADRCAVRDWSRALSSQRARRAQRLQAVLPGQG
uniref:T6SS phospholipase effector Tle1-like catalytic domain-containing protein n=1 Tax=Bradyrhizobium diazoefficiens TaxID=1355477 RepID=UPI0036F23BD9